jgi:hypothetical protein
MWTAFSVMARNPWDGDDHLGLGWTLGLGFTISGRSSNGMRNFGCSSGRRDFGCISNRPVALRFDGTNRGVLADQNQATEANWRTCRTVMKPAAHRLRPAQASRQPYRISVLEASRRPPLGTDLGFAGIPRLWIAEQLIFTLTKP